MQDCATAMSDEKKPVDTAPRRRWLPLAVAGVLVLVAASAVAGKYWIIPASARQRFRDTILHYWDGTLEIDRMEGGYFSPIRATGLTLRDHEGRLWVRADSVTLSYTPLPSLSDQLSFSSIEGLELTLHIDSGHCRPPVQNIPDFIAWLEEQFSIEEFSVPAASVTTYCDGRPGGLWDGFDFVCRRQPGGRQYKLELTRPGPAGGKGSCPGRLEARIKARWPDGGKLVYDGEMTFDGLKADDLLRAFGMEKVLVAAKGVAPPPMTVRGRYDFAGEELTVETVKGRGKLRADCSAARGSLWPEGTLGEIDFAVAGPVVSIGQARFATPISNVSARDAGRLNLLTGEIDVSMTSTPRGGLSALAASFLGGQARMFATKTVRIHLTGRWDVYENLKITLSPQD